MSLAKRLALILAALLTMSAPALAQTDGGFTFGQSLSTAALNRAFAAKQDYAAALAVPAAGTGIAPGSLSAAGVTLEQWGGGCKGSSFDNTVAWNAMLAALANARATNPVLVLGPCTYYFTTKPGPLSINLLIQGGGWNQTTLARNYNGASASDCFIDVRYSYGALRDLDIAAVTGTSSGIGLCVVSDDTTTPKKFGNWNTYTNLRVVGGVGSDDTGTWSTAILLDGTNGPAGAPGLRDLSFVNVWAESGTANEIVAHTLEHFSWLGGGWLQLSGGESENFVIDNPSGSASANIVIEPNVGRCLTLTNVQRVTVLGAYVCTGGSTVASSVATSLVIPAGNSPWTNSSATTTLITTGYLSVAGYLQPAKLAVSGLPTCNAGLEGAEYSVTDANSTTFHAALVGGGSNHVKGFCNGSGWVIGG